MRKANQALLAKASWRLMKDEEKGSCMVPNVLLKGYYGGWEMYLPNDLVSCICSIHAGYNGSGEDKAIWERTKDGNFTVNTAYNAMNGLEKNAEWKWKGIWKLQIPPKLKMFMWMLLHHKLLTNQQRSIRGLDDSASCSSCGAVIEDLNHLFRGCSTAKKIWEIIGYVVLSKFLGKATK
ncbi:hypothetical protein ACOSP7_007391 [Xanthoceras sorbifolium]